MRIYTYCKRTKLVAVKAEGYGEGWMEYVGAAETFEQAATLAAKHNEKVTGRKLDCINIQNAI